MVVSLFPTKGDPRFPDNIEGHLYNGFDFDKFVGLEDWCFNRFLNTGGQVYVNGGLMICLSDLLAAFVGTEHELELFFWNSATNSWVQRSF